MFFFNDFALRSGERVYGSSWISPFTLDLIAAFTTISKKKHNMVHPGIFTKIAWSSGQIKCVYICSDIYWITLDDRWVSPWRSTELRRWCEEAPRLGPSFPSWDSYGDP